MTLDSFMRDFLREPLADFRMLEHRNSGNRTSAVVCRVGRFQAELIFWGANLFLPAHRHPNLHGKAVHISGDMTFILGRDELHTNYLISRADVWKAKFYRDRVIDIAPGNWHGGKTGSTGASFWAFQEWNGEMTAASQDWVGGKIPKADLCVLNQNS